MNVITQADTAAGRLMSGNEAVARGVWEAGAKVGVAYPGTPSTEILENLATYPDIHTHWSINEKVSLEVAIGASVAGARAFCAMKHVGMNVAADALMSQTLAGVAGGLVIAIADDVGCSSSQNEQDSRYWGRFGHLPILEPSDSQEAYEMIKEAFELSERFECPVIVRMTTGICHVKTLVRAGERTEAPDRSFERDPTRWVLVPVNARGRQDAMFARDAALAEYVLDCPQNVVEEGADKRIGFVASGPAYMNLLEVFPDANVFKLGMSHPLPIEAIRRFAKGVERLLVVEETEPLVELELRAAGIEVHGKDVLPRKGELTPAVLRDTIRGFLGEPVAAAAAPQGGIFPRPPTMCSGCPHLPVYYCLAKLTKKARIVGDIGCYTLGAGHPWNALDTTTCVGASMGMALGMDLARGEADTKDAIVSVIGDSTFLHMGMQGMLEIAYNRGNVTTLLLDNSATAMTGGQDHAGTGRDIHGDESPRVDFVKLVQALGVPPERVRMADPFNMPEFYKTLREEIGKPEPSVIVTNQPCTLIDRFETDPPFRVIEDECTGCTNCLDVGCPAIHVTRTGKEVKASGREVDLKWVRIDTAACTGCGLCEATCSADAIVKSGIGAISAAEAARP